MNEEMLSQDQIDALSNGAELGDLGGPAADAGQGAAADVTWIAKAFELLAEQATTVLTTVVGKEVRLSCDDCAPASVDAVRSQQGKNHLLLGLQFNKGFAGALFFLVSKKDTAVLADLMMMGDGNAEYEEDHKDAIGELFNQIMGAASTAFGVQYSMECGVTPATVATFDPEAAPMNLAECTAVKMGLKMQGVADSSMLFLVPADLAKAISEKASSAAQPEPAPAAETGPQPAGQAAASANTAQFANFSQPMAMSSHSSATPGNINMLLDIQLQVAIELGRTEMSIKRILELGPGAIIELDRMAGEPVDLLVNGKVVAKGEVVVVDENFGIRVVSLVSPEERLKSLK